MFFLRKKKLLIPCMFQVGEHTS